ncbi:MAG: indolepyruvate ferredoxin oxidoreductase subunit alpha [Oscillospiraceae bacterium]|nr:indolepyruvate ferredoxin oxidoreductase subunit alpha [Oscillospiraceae bacterium]
MKSLLWMGNEAIAHGALHAGITLASGYPGTPSTEALETIARLKPEGVHVEWSVNEKVALEVAAGACYAGARALVTMKQVGLNVASDPLMSLNYIGVKGGMVILAADDPGPISSQTEQDTRRFAQFARLPVLDPSNPEEAYAMTRAAFDISEELRVPVIIRPTTRVCHACACVAPFEPLPPKPPEGFRKGREWVIFPRLSYESKKRIVAREQALSDALARFNIIEEPPEPTDCGIACGGISYAYVKEALERTGLQCRVLKVGAPNPFPNEIAERFLDGLSRVIVAEELDPVIEDALRPLCAARRIPLRGKADASLPSAGEYSVAALADALRLFVGGVKLESPGARSEAPPNPPARPPVLCAGCPHRASFYAVKRAVGARRAIYCGDIGCYTLGNAPPLDMVDTCLCMGAGITIAQGLRRTERDTPIFAFIGDSTFFHTGMPGVLNAVYNNSDIIICVLDNRTTGMTGQQPHPGIGKTATGEPAPAADIGNILNALGVDSVRRVNAFDLDQAERAVSGAMDESGVRAILFEGPCIAVAARVKPQARNADPLRSGAEPPPYMTVRESECVGCKICVRKLGCPAMSIIRDKRIAAIDPALCTGCGLCAKVCPVNCIVHSTNGGEAATR